MSTITTNQPTWLDDLMSARDVSPKDREGYVFVLTWFEKWRLAKQVDCSMKSARQFWMDQVCAKKRHAWQLESWAEAFRWFKYWLSCCKRNGKSADSLVDRVRNAVLNCGARRGLAYRTRETYARCVCYGTDPFLCSSSWP